MNATPVITAMNPVSVVQGADWTTVAIWVLGAHKDSLLYWNGKVREAHFEGEAPIRQGVFYVTLSPTELSEAFVARVQIRNPEPGGGLSDVALFTVQPRLEPGSPVIALSSNIFRFGEGVPLGPKITISGTGFTRSNRAYWDGVEVPLEYVSAERIDVTPPAADLARWGTHDFFVANGSHYTATKRLHVVRTISALKWVTDPDRNRLYMLTRPAAEGLASTLLVMDLKHGYILQTLSDVVVNAQAMAVSADGTYIYLASGPSKMRLTRFNTSTGAIDLDWQTELYGTHGTFGTVTLLTVSGFPETLVVAASNTGVRIFDRDQRRLINSVEAGFQAVDMPIFATTNRLYLSATDGSCWRWMDFDEGGISGGNPVCSLQPPADAIRDGGVLYFTDGHRQVVVSAPENLTTYLRVNLPPVVDPAHRKVFRIQAWEDAVQVIEHDLDTAQERDKGALHPDAVGVEGISSAAAGAVLLVMRDFVAMLP